MTRPIRAFLMMHCGRENWSVSVCRDLEAVVETWNARADPTQTGVLHIGFDRPPSSAFEVVVSAHPGRLLLTASARFGMPRGYEASENPIGFVDNLPIHLGTRGWGYIVETAHIPTVERRRPSLVTGEPAGWVASFLSLQPDFADALAQAGIIDEASYLEHEGVLPYNERHRMGIFRYRALIGEHDHDPCAIARAAPPWLAERTFETMNLTVRVAHVFAKRGVKTVADLQKYDLLRLLSLASFGRKSASDLRASLLRALDDGPFAVEVKIEKGGVESLRVALHRTLILLDDRERDILARRMGLRRSAETLQTIADDYKVTRERIRQIESKVVKRVIKEAYWDDLLIGKLEALLAGREFPLPVLGVEAVDPWFAGVSEAPEAIRYILNDFCGDRIGIVRIDGVDYFGFLQQGEWEIALAEARRVLSCNAEKRWSTDHCKAVVSPLVKENAREFRGIFWQKAIKLCHFGDDGDGQRVLIAYGRGADQVVEAILSDAERPLHYSEIAVRASNKAGRPIDIRRAHNAAAAVGVLIARGTYGLEKHIGLSPDEADVIREEAENVVLTSPGGRQWHASEICSTLLERDISTKTFDKYVIDFLLRRSGAVRRLGRMTWVTSQGSAASAAERIDIHQAIVSLVQEAGRPLSTCEVRQRLVALRGVNETFQIFGADPLIRLGPGLWGLNDRDLPIKRCDHSKLTEDVVETLRLKGSGIHISEAEDMALQASSDLTPSMLFSLASLDARMCVGTGQYLYLDEWGDSRRETMLEAVRQVLTSAGQPLAFESIAELVADRMQRRVQKSAILACLQSIALAVAIPETGNWVFSAEKTLQADEEDFAVEVTVTHEQPNVLHLLHAE